MPLAAYGGMGDRMGQCMEYASESTCLKQTCGGADFGKLDATRARFDTSRHGCMIFI
jgi:hypothetical protein